MLPTHPLSGEVIEGDGIYQRKQWLFQFFAYVNPCSGMAKA
jgi:hypothetical protein